ncbi:MAG: hypothetical protein KHX42_10410 [Prevotella sp.]|nr:hypothetical protein [Prevotella sp.]
MKNKYSHEHDAKLATFVCAHKNISALFSYHYYLLDVCQNRCFKNTAGSPKTMPVARGRMPEKMFWEGFYNILKIKTIPFGL